MSLPSEIADFANLAQFVEPVGSRVTCNPAPTDTDADYLALVTPNSYAHAVDLLRQGGWQLGGSDCDDMHIADESGGGILSSPFASYTLGEVNLIVTGDESFFVRFMAATSVAKRLNLLDKGDRIALFQAVLYGNADHGSPEMIF